MANLIEYIQSQVYENSTEDISGSIMQQVLTRMASDEGVVNVHTISGQTPFADYNNAQAARDAVPAGFKKLGLIITYKLSSGWYIDEFIGSATSGWSTASNWKCLGPISVSQNASTGKTTITIGSDSYDVATQPVSVSQKTLNIGGVDKGAISDSWVDNPEFISVETDSEGKVLSSRNKKGVKKEYVGLEVDGTLNAKKIVLDDKDLSDSMDVIQTSKYISDPEDRIAIDTDAEQKVLSYRDKKGVMHEEVGFCTKKLRADDIEFGAKARGVIEGLINENTNVQKIKSKVKQYTLPKYGVANIASETFYLPSDGWSDFDTDVELRQIYQNVSEITPLCTPISRFYTITNNIPLLFFAASQVREEDGAYIGTTSVTKVDGNCYYTDTLGYSPTLYRYVVLEHSMQVTLQDEPAEQQSVNVEVAVRQVTSSLSIDAWAVNKNVEHHCVVELDFGYFLSGEYNMGVKYQGSSTLRNFKKNFRFTFYKNSTFAKKDKIKIGEFVRLSGFNLKAEASDSTRMRENVLYRVFEAIWENREMYSRYPWQKDSDELYTGATGLIKAFPIRLNINGTFYGIMFFGLKKDKANYMLVDDENETDGLLVCGTRNDATAWTNTSASDWDEEFADVMPQSTIDALNAFFTFVNGEYFDADNIPTHLSLRDWIDYFICLQVFIMKDNTCRNLMLYSNSQKVKMFPFFYDLDLALYDISDAHISDDILQVSYSEDMSIWENFSAIYADRIRNRYYELRKDILSVEYIKDVFEDIAENIPTNDASLENSKWGNVSIDGFISVLNFLEKRLQWLDENNFNL